MKRKLVRDVPKEPQSQAKSGTKVSEKVVTIESCRGTTCQVVDQEKRQRKITHIDACHLIR